MSLDEMRIKFSKVLTGRLSAVYKTSCVEGNPYEKSGVPEAFDWLALAIQISKSGKLTGVIQKELDPALLDPRSQTTIMQKLNSWLTRTETDIGVEEFKSTSLDLSVCPVGITTPTSASRTCI